MAAKRKRKKNQLDKGKLWKEIRREDRKKAREKMRSLKAGSAGARESRRETRAKTAAECRAAKVEAKAKAADVCDAGQAAYQSARAAHARARAALLEEKAARRELRAIERSAKGREAERKKRGPSVAERKAEGDDAVRANIDPDLVPLFEQIKHSIKGSARMSRTEEFLHYVEEHPDEVIAAQGDPYERAAAVMQARAAQNPSKLPDEHPLRVMQARAAANPFAKPAADTDARIERDVRAIIADQDKRKKALGAFLEANEGRAFSIYLRAIRDVGLVSRDPSKPEQWRLTRFDGDEPIGHSEHENWQSAARYAVEDYRGDMSRVTFHNPRTEPMAKKKKNARPPAERRTFWTAAGLKKKQKLGTKQNPGKKDDRTDPASLSPYGYVIARDTFMSGWGEAPGTSYYALAVRSEDEAYRVLANFRDRSEFKNVHFARKLPKIGARDQLSVGDWHIAPRFYKAGAFASNPGKRGKAKKIASWHWTDDEGEGAMLSVTLWSDKLTPQQIKTEVQSLLGAHVEAPADLNVAYVIVPYLDEDDPGSALSKELGAGWDVREENPKRQRQRYGKKAAAYVAEELRARKLQPKGHRRAKKQAVAIGLSRARRAGATVPSKKNPPLSPAEAKERYKRDHWGNAGEGEVRRSKAPDPKAGTLVELGELIEVVYRTRKGGDRQSVDYEHAFKKGRPVLAYNDTGLVIVDGDYTVTTRGIVG